MKPMTPRVARLREIRLQKEYGAWLNGWRAYYAAEALMAQDTHTPLSRRKTLMLSHIIDHMPVRVGDEQPIVGDNYAESSDELIEFLPFSANAGQELFADPASSWWERMRSYLQTGSLPEDKQALILDYLARANEILPYVSIAPQTVEESAKRAQAGLFVSYCVCENHTVLGYEKVLRLGFEGIKAEAEAMLAALDYRDPQTVYQRAMLDDAVILCGAASRLGKRFAQAAEAAINDSLDSGRKAELAAMAQTCRQVPAHPARTLHEAVQALWTAHILNTWEDGINANSLGRIDQILYPYYKADLESGRMTQEEAYELLCCLWLKLYRSYDVQQAMVGGVDADGNDATNPLSFMMLDVTETMDFVRCLSVRWHKNTPSGLMRRAMELIKTGKGIPFFFNDEVIIPAITAGGVDIRDARGYAAIGCVELTIPGKCNPHAVSNRFNLLKCLELALFNGKDIRTGAQTGPETGDAAQFTSMDDVLKAYYSQAEDAMMWGNWECVRQELSHSTTRPMPYKSLLTEGCLESGFDFNRGGAKYNWHESMAMGIPNVADSLAAIDHLVFREKKHELAEMLGQLASDFPSEAFRQECIHRSPKYGNDEPLADGYARAVTDHFCEETKRYKSIFKGHFVAQPFTFLWLIEQGAQTAASADGRKSGDNLAYSLSPMAGRDENGLTAVLKSLAKLPHDKAGGSTSAIIEMNPLLLDEKHFDTTLSLLETALRLGIGQLQFNVVNAETLREAQREPEKHRSLEVRVSGFSQRFCLLEEDLQNHIIARTKHEA